jgi:hypothetical protein
MNNKGLFGKKQKKFQKIPPDSTDFFFPLEKKITEQEKKQKQLMMKIFH